jgi:Trypsin
MIMRGRQTDRRNMDPKRFNSCVEAASEFARLVAGDDDAVYVQVLAAAVNIAAAVEDAAADGVGRAEAAARVLVRNEAVPPGRRDVLRTRSRPGPEARDVEVTIFHDRMLQANVKRMIADRTRIKGGVETRDFPDCVAVGSADSWCCSGTLIAATVVVTAAHCYRNGGCHERVFIGQDVAVPDRGRVVRVGNATMHPAYDPASGSPFNDIMILVLDEPVEDATHRPIAAAEALQDAFSVRLVGYGDIDAAGEYGYGRRRVVDVPLAAADPRFGAEPDLEFVAAAPLLGKDSCTGDSGGPAYVEYSGAWYLAGATSRSTKDAVRMCGDGGIYTRVPAYVDWIRSVAGDRLVV